MIDSCNQLTEQLIVANSSASVKNRKNDKLQSMRILCKENYFSSIFFLTYIIMHSNSDKNSNNFWKYLWVLCKIYLIFNNWTTTYVCLAATGVGYRNIPNSTILVIQAFS
jgi:hypothetical protein